MSNEKLMPKLRFDGVKQNKWKETELGNIANLSSSKRVHQSDYVEYGIPFFRGSEISKLGNSSKLKDVFYISKELFNELKIKHGVPKIGDILITAVGTLGNSYLISNDIPFYFKDGNLIWLRDISIESEYLSIYLSSEIGRKRVLDSAVGSNQKALTMVKLQNVNIFFPDKEEQIKIGTFFKKIDEIIQLQQSKVNKVKNIKSAYLSEMFPKEGEKYPKKRFEGFLRSWEICHLGQVAGINKGEQLNKEKMVRSGKYYVLNGGIEPSGYTNNYNTKEQTISISEGGNSCGYVNYNEEKFWSGGHNYVLTNPKINVLYLYYFLKSRQDEIMSLRVGSGLPNIQITALSEFDISYPLRYEQEKIGQFFRNLDNQISIEEEKLMKLEKLKQAYLNDMFV